MRHPLLSALLGLLIFSTPAIFAKDLSHRLGIGYANQFGTSRDIPSIAARYYPSENYGFMAALGVDTQTDASRFGIQAKFLRLIFKEDNLNFYTGAGAALVSEETPDNNSGFDLSGFFGCEFFLPGLENLGVNFEAGVGVTSLSDEVRFRTIADHPLRAGMFFYF